MSIGHASATDLAPIATLLTAAKLPTDDLTLALLDSFVVLREGDVVVGVGGIEWHGDDGLLRSIAVAPLQQGKGIGTRIVDALEAQAKARGAEVLYLLTTTADRYFAGLGYQLASRDSAPAGIRQTAQFAGLCPSSSSFMVKGLR